MRYVDSSLMSFFYVKEAMYLQNMTSILVRSEDISLKRFVLQYLKRFMLLLSICFVFRRWQHVVKQKKE